MAQSLSRRDYAYVDYSDPLALLSYAKKLEGHTFREVLELGITPEDGERPREGTVYAAMSFKGGLGTLLEESYFGYRANDNPEADFKEAATELKTSCYDVTTTGKLRAGERLVLGMIAYDRTIELPLKESHMWEKGGRILLIYYRRDKTVDRLDQRITYVSLFTPPEKDMAVIEGDYARIQQYVMEGRAHELSESMTNYLGACTKGATAEKSMRDQSVYAPGVKARGRAWCYKGSYMNVVLNEYIVGESRGPRQEIGSSDEVIKDTEAVRVLGFDGYVLSLIEPYIGKTDREICDTFGLKYTGNKAQWTSIVYRMLGVKGNHAEEFSKANVSIRVVRAKANGRIKESLSLSTFRFSDLLEESWDDAPLREYLESTRFFFVVFQETSRGYVLRGAKFWSMPLFDVEGPVLACWSETRDIVKEGVRLTIKVGSSGRFTILNNLPGKKENPVTHVRSHSAQAAYLLENGTLIGNIERDGDELPDGRWMTKQSFWLNNDYVEKIVEEVALRGEERDAQATAEVGVDD